MRAFEVEYHIYEIREKRNLSLRQLEILSDVSKAEINNIENGRRHPTVPTLYKLSVALKAPICDLFTVKLK